MKFCKNLSDVIRLADPAWGPYWLNYKALKKKLKNLPHSTTTTTTSGRMNLQNRESESSDDPDAHKQQKSGVETTEKASRKRSRSSMDRPQRNNRRNNNHHHHHNDNNNNGVSSIGSLRQNPAEVDFFKALQAELKKAERFFHDATKEHKIRLQRLRQGVVVVKNQERTMMDDKWNSMSKAMSALYKDLLLLETFAIMTYVGFSKILKKHDKTTGFHTCSKYMSRIVSRANFTHYPEVMAMISKAQEVNEEISEAVELEGNNALSHDEQLFINMIQKVNEEALGEGTKSRDDMASYGRDEDMVNEADDVGDLKQLLGEEQGQSENISEQDTKKTSL